MYRSLIVSSYSRAECSLHTACAKWASERIPFTRLLDVQFGSALEHSTRQTQSIIAKMKNWFRRRRLCSRFTLARCLSAHKRIYAHTYAHENNNARIILTRCASWRHLSGIFSYFATFHRQTNWVVFTSICEQTRRHLHAHIRSHMAFTPYQTFILADKAARHEIHLTRDEIEASYMGLHDRIHFGPGRQMKCQRRQLCNCFPFFVCLHLACGDFFALANYYGASCHQWGDAASIPCSFTRAARMFGFSQTTKAEILHPNRPQPFSSQHLSIA